MIRRNREIVIFNLSAIDLFCSGMGAVMVLMVLLMPYYRNELKTPPQPKPEPTVVVTPPAQPQPTPPQPAPPEVEEAVRIRAVDVVFVMDTTGSMEDELNEVKNGMTSVVKVLRRLSDEVRVGFVTYVDRKVSFSLPLEPMAKGKIGDANLQKFIQAISEINLDGGRDWPEDVCAGIAKAVSLDWTIAADRRQIIVVIGDARTHPEDRDQSMTLVREWSSASADRSVNAVFTEKIDPKLDASSLAELNLSKQYFQELAKEGKGQFLDEQGDLLGSILDIIIIR